MKEKEPWNQMGYDDYTITRVFSNINYPGNDIDCWPWIGTILNTGYGQIGYNGKQYTAHRFILECYRGPIKNSDHVLHICDNPRCVNPSHLRLGTHQDNMKDMVSKQRQTHGSKNPMAKLDETKVIEILEAIKSGQVTTRQEIYNKYKIGNQIIYKILNRKLWTIATINYSDTELHNMILTINQSRKLSEEDVKNIKLDLKNNIQRTIIAKKYNIHRDTVSNIYTGKTWSHIVI